MEVAKGDFLGFLFNKGAAIVTNTGICYSGHEKDVGVFCFGEVILCI